VIDAKGYWPRVAEGKVRRAGRRHAKKRQGVLVDDVLLSRLGREPVVDIVNDPLQARREEERHGDPRLPTWQSEFEKVDDQLTRYSNPWPLRFAFLFLLIVEFAGMLQLLKAQGMESGARVIVAAAASTILFYFSYRASKEVV
jgi:hypothetical protein